MIIDQIVARTADNDVRAAVAVDRLVAGAAGNRVGSGRSQDREIAGDARRRDIGDIENRGRSRRILIGRVGKIEAGGRLHDQRVGAAGAAVDRYFGSVIIDRIDAGARVDGLGAAVAVDSVIA